MQSGAEVAVRGKRRRASAGIAVPVHHHSFVDAVWRLPLADRMIWMVILLLGVLFASFVVVMMKHRDLTSLKMQFSDTFRYQFGRLHDLAQQKILLGGALQAAFSVHPFLSLEELQKFMKISVQNFPELGGFCCVLGYVARTVGPEETEEKLDFVRRTVRPDLKAPQALNKNRELVYTSLEDEHYILVSLVGEGDNSESELGPLIIKRVVGGDYLLHPEGRFEILKNLARTGGIATWHRNEGLAVYASRWMTALSFPIYNASLPDIPDTEELRVKHHVGFVQAHFRFIDLMEYRVQAEFPDPEDRIQVFIFSDSVSFNTSLLCAPSHLDWNQLQSADRVPMVENMRMEDKIQLGKSLITVLGTPSVEMRNQHMSSQYLLVFVLINVLCIIVSITWLAYAIKNHSLALLSQARELGYQWELEVKRQMRRDLKQEKRHLQTEVSHRSAAEMRAREAVEARTQFFSKMSVEIRTPMHAILSLVEEMYADPALDPSHHEMVATIKESSATLLTILSDLLDYSAAETGMLRVQPSWFTLGDFFGYIVSLFSWKASHAHIDLNLGFEAPQFYPPSMPELMAVPQSSLLSVSELQGAAAFADPHRIRQVLYNIISNALKFSHSRVVIRVACVPSPCRSCEVVDDDSCRGCHSLAEPVPTIVGEKEYESDFVLHVEVEDDGPGIPTDQIEEIFQSFVQVVHSFHASPQGTGLGLAVCKMVLELLHGSIHVFNAKTGGACFVVNIPILVQRDKSKVAALLPRRSSLTGIVNLGEGLSWKNNLATAGNDTAHGGDGRSLRLRGGGVPRTPVSGRPGLRGESPHAGSTSFVDMLDSVGDGGASSDTTSVEDPSPHLSVLCVDDNATNSRILLRMLRGLSREALDLCGQRVMEVGRLFDLVLMDCQMPVMDGYEASRRILSLAKEHRVDRVCILAITANALPEQRRDAFACGMQDIVHKPFQKSTLAAAIRNVLTPSTQDASPHH